MGGQIYVTKSVMVGGTKIEVRQPLFKGRDGVLDLVKDVTTDARRLMNETLSLCNPSGFMKDARRGTIKGGVPDGLFQTLFLQPPDHQVLSTIWAKLVLISAALNAPFALKVYTQTDGTLGYVNKYFPMSRLVAHTGSDGKSRSRVSLGSLRFGKCARVDGDVLRDSRFGKALIGRGEVHVAFERLNSPMGPKTLIHEFGHKFANLADFSYMYDYRYADPITSANTLLNADSYAWLAFLAPAAAAKASVKNQVRSAANVDALDGGLGALFG
jgi:hypothetical protein